MRRLQPDGPVDLGITGDQFQRPTGGRGRIQQRRQYRRDVVATDGATGYVALQPDPTDTGLIGQVSRSQHGPVQITTAEVLFGRELLPPAITTGMPSP